jgi:hypothetical protein
VVAVSLTAILLALTATALSVYAIAVASAAVDKKAGATAQAPTDHSNQPTDAATAPAAPTTAQPSAGAQPTGATTRASAGELDPKANFTDAYTPSLQKLSIHPTPGGYRYVDLDKPQVGGQNGTADLTFHDRVFTFEPGTGLGVATSAEVQPKDCVDLIRTAGLDPATSIPASTPDLTLCISTSFAEAKAQGITWKMVVLHVTAVATDGTIQVDLRAWNIPG